MYKSEQANKVIEHMRAEYGAEPEFLWPERYPNYAIFRHGDNRKWFALVGVVSRKSLGLADDADVEIINLKFDKNQTYDFAETSDHIFPAYHMNKKSWVTVVLDGTVPLTEIKKLLDKSYTLT